MVKLRRTKYYYFLRYTLPMWFEYNVFRRFREAIYWIKCHTLKSYKFHIVDLRGVDSVHKYKYGYKDPGAILELACWAMLRKYVEECKPSDPETWAGPDLVKEGGEFYHNKIVYDEVMGLYDWWTKGRLKYVEDMDNLYEERRKAIKNNNIRLINQMNKKLSEYRDFVEKQEDEKFEQLIRLRKQLWD